MGQDAGDRGGVGSGWRCRNGWLKKLSNGMRSRALRRSNPNKRSANSGDVPEGILHGVKTVSFSP
jgi:hypothetical protein